MMVEPIGAGGVELIDRLLGVMAADLTAIDAAPEDGLFAQQARRARAREEAIEALRDRFGRQAVIRGPLYRGP